VQLTQITATDAARFHPALDTDALAALDPDRAMRAKQSQGGTAPERVREQLAVLRDNAKKMCARADAVPSLDAIAEAIRAESL
jgi:argininosuccinate lyase